MCVYNLASFFAVIALFVGASLVVKQIDAKKEILKSYTSFNIGLMFTWIPIQGMLMSTIQGRPLEISYKGYTTTGNGALLGNFLLLSIGIFVILDTIKSSKFNVNFFEKYLPKQANFYKPKLVMTGIASVALCLIIFLPIYKKSCGKELFSDNTKSNSTFCCNTLVMSNHPRPLDE